MLLFVYTTLGLNSTLLLFYTGSLKELIKLAIWYMITHSLDVTKLCFVNSMIRWTWRCKVQKDNINVQLVVITWPFPEMDYVTILSVLPI